MEIRIVRKRTKKSMTSILKRLIANCQQKDGLKFWFFCNETLRSRFLFIIFNSLLLSHSIQVWGLGEGVIEIFTPILRVTKSVILKFTPWDKPLGWKSLKHDGDGHKSFMD